MSGLTHLDAAGRARMVDVSDKPVTPREAVAAGFVSMGAETLALALSGTAAPGQDTILMSCGVRTVPTCRSRVASAT